MAGEKSQRAGKRTVRKAKPKRAGSLAGANRRTGAVGRNAAGGPEAELGTVKSSLRGRVTAGSWQTCSLTYTAGTAGIDDTGAIKLVLRYASDCGVPQFTDPAAPHYTTAVASNGVLLELRYDSKDHERPWGRTVRVRVRQGFLRQGETITLTLGDRSGGSPGWRMQTFVEDTFELRVLIDRYATCVYEQLARSPELRIVPGAPVRMVAVAPGLAAPGKTVAVRTRLEDEWGNPVGRPRTFRQEGFTEAGYQTAVVTDEETGLQAESNPVLVTSDAEYGRYWADLHGQSEETIGTNTVEQYFQFARDRAFLDIASHQGNDFQITDAFWQHLQQVTRAMNRSGKFVAFPGWEWSGNTGLGGDRNVFFREEGGPIHRSSRALVRTEDSTDECAGTVEELFDRMETCGQDVMLAAHVGGRYADIARHREGLESAVEVHSAWGTFEWMLEDAFSRGYRVAVVANSDGHKGRPGASWPGASTFGSYGGLTCVLATQLDREAVWEAYRQRRVYATTGARIQLDVATTSGDQMGSLIHCRAGEPPELAIRVCGTAPLERVEIRNGTRVLKTVRAYQKADLADRLKVLWQGAQVRGRGRAVSWDGGLKLKGNRIGGFTPVNFHNPEQPCRQTGAGELSWQSITTGGVAGVIVDLARGTAGTLEVETPLKRFRVETGKLSLTGRRYELGGVGLAISAYRLPASGGPREMEFRFQPRLEDMHQGDNPLMVHVVQEDGHMAWSSPIYAVQP
ncbi:MAG: DUF3604 domain-containing protein [Planctomycetaceae bacterium]|nr:DUF3604 domain-containing protein [Planctomycetaceae bacterium]